MNIDVNLLGSVAAFLSVISFIPQVVKTWKTKRTKDISLPMYVILLTGAFLWVIYGMTLQMQPIIATNLIIFVLGTFILILKLKHG